MEEYFFEWLKNVFPLENITNKFSSLIPKIELLALDFSDLETALENSEQEWENLDQEIKDSLVGQLNELLGEACGLLTNFLELLDSEDGGISILDALIKKLSGFELKFPEGDNDTLKDNIGELEKGFIIRAGLPLTKEEIDQVISDIKASIEQPAKFAKNERSELIQKIENFQKIICRIHKQNENIIHHLTGNDLRNIVGGLKDICVITVDITSALATSFSVMMVFVSVKSIVTSGQSLSNRIDQLNGRFTEYFVEKEPTNHEDNTETLRDDAISEPARQLQKEEKSRQQREYFREYIRNRNNRNN